jgi:hypothetical protein
MTALSRAAAMLLDPAAAWARIEREPADPVWLLTHYVALLGLIPALFGFLGATIVGVKLPGTGTLRTSLVDGVLGAIFGYVETFAVVLLLGLLIDRLAPLFGGQRGFDSALKLAVYSYTPVWLAGIFLVLPGLRFLMLTGFFGVYLLAMGLPRLMKASEAKTPTYVLTVAAFAVALTYAAAAAQRGVFGTPGLSRSVDGHALMERRPPRGILRADSPA